MHAYFEKNILDIYPIAISTWNNRVTEAQVWLILAK
jgi:hypothetical protein